MINWINLWVNNLKASNSSNHRILIINRINNSLLIHQVNKINKVIWMIILVYSNSNNHLVNSTNKFTIKNSNLSNSSNIKQVPSKDLTTE
jgi:hypothetical protein